MDVIEASSRDARQSVSGSSFYAAMRVLPHAQRHACTAVVDRALGHFGDARRIMSPYPLPIVRAPLLMTKVYQNILERLAARGWAPPRRAIRASRARLLWILVRHGAFEMGPRREM